jgi:hypothetical protein
MSEPEKINKRPFNIDAETYDVSHLRYPENVAVDPTLQHYVCFYINVPEGTATKLSNEKVIGYVKNTGANVNNENAKTGLLAAAGAGAGAASSMSLLKVFNKLGGNTSLKGAAITALGGAFAGAVGGAAVAAAFPKTQYQRISDVITLHLNSVPTSTYNARWMETELGTLGGIISGGSSAADSTIMNSGGDMAKIAMRNAIKIPGNSKMGNTIGTIGGGFNGEAVAAAITKEIPNPFREQIFKQIDFRTFEFYYHFMPKSQKEMKAVQDIINTFKFHQHPELSDTGLFFKFPSQFDIVYYFKGEENKYLNKIATCALENCSVSYNNDMNKFSSFNDGAPVEVTMTLVFRELELLTKNRIKDGY